MASQRLRANRAPLLERIQRTTVAASAYEAIREGILDHRFAPGDVLTEAELADELHVSRGTVREALQRLREDGLVVQVPPRGLAVRVFSIDDVVDIFNARIGLEAVALRLAMRARADVAPLARCAAALVAAAERGDERAVNAHELRFHATLCELSGNRCLAELHARIGTQIRMALTLDYGEPGDPVPPARDHEQLVEVIRAGDEEAAVRALIEHVVRSITQHLGVSRTRFVGLDPP